MNNEIIKILYEKLINIVLNGLNEEEKNIGGQEYYNILINRYSDKEIDEKIFQKIINMEYNEWINIDIDMKKHILLKDKALEEIINLTSKAFKVAQDRLIKNIIIPQQEAEQNIMRIEELYPLVKEYNQQLAKWHMSEGIMDYNYACGKTDNMSMRIGHYK